jgi:hypothetical protein
MLPFNARRITDLIDASNVAISARVSAAAPLRGSNRACQSASAA